FFNGFVPFNGTTTFAANDGTHGLELWKLVPGVSSRLTFVQQPPTTASAGQPFSPTVKVAITDQFGVVVTSDNSTVTLTLSSGTFAGGSTTFSVAAVNGIATFTGLTLNASDPPGAYTLVASDGSLSTATSTQINVNPPVLAVPAPVKVLLN